MFLTLQAQNFFYHLKLYDIVHKRRLSCLVCLTDSLRAKGMDDARLYQQQQTKICE